MLCHITIILLSFVQTDSEAQDEHEVKVWIFLDFFGAAPGPATVLQWQRVKSHLKYTVQMLVCEYFM